MLLKNNILFLLVFLGATFVSYADLSLEGHYQGKNLYVQNPEDEDGFGFCVTKATVNGDPIVDGLQSSAFEIDFTAFQSDASQLESYKAKKVNLAWPELRLKSNLLRSNCRVTNQPDWGDVYIKIKGENLPTADSLAKYIVSHRTVSHFHEEICEMVYKHLTDAYQPEELMVACLYTRRGGLDINPVRASHNMLIPAMFEEKEFRLAKTLRQ